MSFRKKIAQNVAQAGFPVNINTYRLPWKKVARKLGLIIIIKKLPVVHNCPTGEYWPNLVTLVAGHPRQTDLAAINHRERYVWLIKIFKPGRGCCVWLHVSNGNFFKDVKSSG
jgi:hypothetical protein